MELLEPAPRGNSIPLFAYDCILVVAGRPRFGCTMSLVFLLVDPSTSCVSVGFQVRVFIVYSCSRSKRKDSHGCGEYCCEMHDERYGCPQITVRDCLTNSHSIPFTVPSTVFICRLCGKWISTSARSRPWNARTAIYFAQSEATEEKVFQVRT